MKRKVMSIDPVIVSAITRPYRELNADLVAFLNDFAEAKILSRTQLTGLQRDAKVLVAKAEEVK